MNKLSFAGLDGETFVDLLILKDYIYLYIYLFFLKVWPLLWDQQEGAADLPAPWAAQNLQ